MNGRACGGCGFWSRRPNFKFDLRQLCPTRFGKRHLQVKTENQQRLTVHQRAIRRAPQHSKEDTMNSIIYIVGLVVIIGVILSYFGFR